MLEFHGRQYRIVPGINRNLPDGLDISYKDKIKIVSHSGPTLTDAILSTTPPKSKEQIRKEKFEIKKNEILLSDKSDNLKKIALLKLEEEFEKENVDEKI